MGKGWLVLTFSENKTKDSYFTNLSHFVQGMIQHQQKLIHLNPLYISITPLQLVPQLENWFGENEEKEKIHSYKCVDGDKTVHATKKDELNIFSFN